MVVSRGPGPVVDRAAATVVAATVLVLTHVEHVAEALDKGGTAVFRGSTVLAHVVVIVIIVGEFGATTGQLVFFKERFGFSGTPRGVTAGPSLSRKTGWVLLGHHLIVVVVVIKLGSQGRRLAMIRTRAIQNSGSGVGTRVSGMV